MVTNRPLSSREQAVAQEHFVTGHKPIHQVTCLQLFRAIDALKLRPVEKVKHIQSTIKGLENVVELLFKWHDFIINRNKQALWDDAIKA